MVKYMLDKGEGRPMVLLYSNKLASDIAYGGIFDEARKRLQAKVVYTLTDIASVPHGWTGQSGPINEKMIREEVPDYAERLFYVSGPNAMVMAMEKMLKGMGIPGSRIKTDFFPGFA